jgi:hypothetical protein
MALDLQPPDGHKRVKVYELRDNDWFDRGTGFCTGTIMGVSSFIHVPVCAALVATATSWARAVSALRLSLPTSASPSLTCATLITGGTANIRRIGRPTAARPAGDQDYERRWLSKTARFLSHHFRPAVSPEREYGLTDLYHAIRDLDCLDGAEWHGYGAEFSRGGRMRSDMVRPVPMTLCVRALG